MAYYYVTAKPIAEKLSELRQRLDSGEIRAMRPFGQALHSSLAGSRRLDAETVAWEEEDYCQPPLAQERAAILDEYFTELRAHPVAKGQAWSKLAGLPSMWTSPADNTD